MPTANESSAVTREWAMPHLSVEEHAARGKAERAEIPRAAHGTWEALPYRPDPIALLEEQAKTRVPELVPIRWGRMLVSPFAFYRGAACVMASDLAGTARSGLRAQLCGDAHLANFGVFGSPERRMVFDINVPMDEFMGADREQLEQQVREILRGYRGSLQDDRRHVLEGYNFADMAHKVVGVGSVGSRAWVILLIGRDDQDPLFLQAKQAHASVLERFLGKSEYPNSGQRVVAGQRMMQAASDIFLGWQRVKGADGIERDFYVRQLRDWKFSAEIAELDRV